MRKAVVWCAAFLLCFSSGCSFVSRGASFDSNKAREFHTETTKADVLRAIGQPLLVTKEGEKETWAYFKGSSQLFGFSLILVTFASDNSKSEYLTLVFTGEKLTGISYLSFLGQPGEAQPPTYAGTPQPIPHLSRSSG